MAFLPVVTRVRRFVGRVLWYLIPILSLGLLAWLPPFLVYRRVRSDGWFAATSYLTLSSVVLAVVFATFPDSALEDAVLLHTILVGIIACFAAEPIVFGGRGDLPIEGGEASSVRPSVALDGLGDGVDPALRSVLEDRERRYEARAIVESDPYLAHELRIGRPDLPRSYWDGGLVDLNHAPVASIVVVLGWERDVARKFVDEREFRQGYASLNEMMALSNVNPVLLERDADRIIILPYRPAT